MTLQPRCLSRVIAAVALMAARRGRHGADRQRFARALRGREGALRAGAQGRPGRQLRHRADVGQLGGAVRRVQASLSRSRDRLQRPGLRGDGRRAREGAQPSAGRHGVLLRRLRRRRGEEGRRDRVQAGQFRQAADGVPRARRQVVHDPLAHDRVRRQHQAREERAAIVGRPAEARVQEQHRLPRPALDRRGAGGCVRRELRGRRRHEQRAAGPRLPRKAARVGQRAARARHDALRAVRQGRDPDLDQLRERRAEGEVDRRPRRRRGGGDPEGGVRRGAVRDQPGRKGSESRTPASCGSTSR